MYFTEVIIVESEFKVQALLALLQNSQEKKIMVFFSSMYSVQYLSKLFNTGIFEFNQNPLVEEKYQILMIDVSIYVFFFIDVFIIYLYFRVCKGKIKDPKSFESSAK